MTDDETSKINIYGPPITPQEFTRQIRLCRKKHEYYDAVVELVCRVLSDLERLKMKVVLSLVLTSVFAATAFSSELIATEAGTILSAIKDTDYSHKSFIDEKTGVYISDCSGFLSYIIARTRPQALEEVKISEGHKSRRAVNFYDTIVRAGKENVPCWTRIFRLEDAEPGDIMVWVNPPDSGDSGHAMIIMEAPVPEGKQLFKIKICDSSKSPHGQDSRASGSNGIGSGFIFVETNENGSPSACRWHSISSKNISRPIVIGRISAN